MLSDTHFAILFRFETDFGLMYTRSARILLPDTNVVTLLRSDTDFSPMYARFARILLSNKHFNVFLLSDADFGLMYIRSDGSALRQHNSLFCYVLNQILV